MGFDVTLHFATSKDIENVACFAEETSDISSLVSEYDLNDDQKDYLSHLRENLRAMDKNASFNTGKGFALASLLGVIRPYWYVRGAAISLTEQAQVFEPYITSWQERLGDRLGAGRALNRFEANYSVGAYIAHDDLKRLCADYQAESAKSEASGSSEDDSLCSVMNKAFNYDRLSVFMEAANYAVENGGGLVEATDLMVPDPMGKNVGEAYTYAPNVRGQGLRLYSEAVTNQIMAFMKQQEAENATQETGLLARLRAFFSRRR